MVTAASINPVSAEALRFVLHGRRHGGRLRPDRRRLLEARLPDLAFGLPASGALEPAALFESPPAEVWLEIGFGSGEHLLAQAHARPDVGIVGCEPYIRGVACLLAAIEAAASRNVRIFTDDARLLLSRLAPASLARVFALFPDPWPKKRHHKRRLISAATLDALARAMADDAELRIATDHVGYGRWILRHLIAHADFHWCARVPADWRRPPPDWPATRYQGKAEAAGRVPIFLVFRRRRRAGDGVQDAVGASISRGKS